MDTTSLSNRGLLGCPSSIRIDSVEKSKDLKSNDSSDEDEEDGGDKGVPPAWMLCQGVADSGDKEPRSNPGVDGSLKRSQCLSVF